MSPFRQLVAHASHRPPLGTWIMSASALVAEAVGHSGFDWGVVDMEHSPLDLGTTVAMLQAIAGTRMLPVLRVTWNDTVTIKRVLDAGAQTLLVPFVQNADEARRAVAATRYPPQGVRGMGGMGRANRFGTLPNYVAEAARDLSVIVQLETPQAIDQLEAIAAVDGVDALFIGPADLSATMGHVGQPTHPAVMSVMSDAAQRCRALRKPIGTIGGTLDVVAQYRAAGYDFLAISTDIGLMVGAAQAAIASLQARGAEQVHTLSGGTKGPATD